MLKALSLGCYCPGSSVLHRADPRTKILLTLLFMTLAYLVQSYAALLLLLLLTLGLADRGGTPLRQSLRSMKLILQLAVVAAAVNLLAVQGTPLIDSGLFRHITREGIDISARMILRIILLAGVSSLLTATTTPFALSDGVERLLKPLQRIGVPVAEIALMLLIALRFLPVIVNEAEKLIMAQTAHATDFNRGNLLQRIRSYLPLFIPLFAGVARRGDAMATAMEARCYRGSAGRSRMRLHEFTTADLVCIGVTLVSLSLLLGVEYIA